MAVTPRLKLPYSSDDAHNEAMNKLDAAVTQDAAGNVDMLSVSIDGVPVNPSGAGPATQLDADGTILDVDAIGDGMVLKRVGTTVVGIVPPGAFILFVDRVFTAAELLALDTTPIVLVPAPNSGLAIMGIKASFQVLGGAVSYPTGTLTLFYGSATGEAVGNSVSYPLLGENKLTIANPTLNARPVADIEGLAIVAGNDDVAPVVGDGTIRVSIVYALIAV